MADNELFLNGESAMDFLIHYEEEYRKSVEGCKYVLNKSQAKKLAELLDFFMDIAENSDNSTIEVSELIPAKEVGGVTANFIIFYIHGKEQIENFARVMSYCSAIGIYAMEDERICFSCTIPKVFVPVRVEE